MLKSNVKRLDGIVITSCYNGNPNGDADGSGDPRQDAEGYGIITPDCTKRKIRDLVEYLHENGELGEGFRIQLSHGTYVNKTIREAYEAAGIDIKKYRKKEKKAEEKPEKEDPDTAFQIPRALAELGNRQLCKWYWDVRTFGGVVTGVGQGRFCGPMQVEFAKSIEPISLVRIGMSRVVTTTKEQSDAQGGRNQGQHGRMIVPYAMYRQNFSCNPLQGLKTGFAQEDLDVFLRAISNQFALSKSSRSGLQEVEQVVVFEHADSLGCARPTDLHEHVRIERVNEGKEPTSWKDYRVAIDRNGLPKGITLKLLLSERVAEKAA